MSHRRRASHTTTVPASASEGMRNCDTQGCLVRFYSAGHRHCCADCRRSGGGSHSRRCRREQRARREELLVSQTVEAGTPFPCVLVGCYRLSSGMHLYCCSSCYPSAGARHTVRCQRRGQPWQQPAPGPHAAHSASGDGVVVPMLASAFSVGASLAGPAASFPSPTTAASSQAPQTTGGALHSGSETTLAIVSVPSTRDGTEQSQQQICTVDVEVIEVEELD